MRHAARGQPDQLDRESEFSRYGGDLAISGMGIVHSITTIFMMPIFGINQGVQPIIGYNYGAKQYERVKEALRLALRCHSVGHLRLDYHSSFPNAAYLPLGRSDAELLELSIKAMRAWPPLRVSSSGNSDSGLCYSSCGQASPSSLLSLSRQLLLLVPALFILPRILGLKGVFISLPVSDIASTLLTVVLLLREVRELNYSGSAVPVRKHICKFRGGLV